MLCGLGEGRHQKAPRRGGRSGGVSMFLGRGGCWGGAFFVVSLGGRSRVGVGGGRYSHVLLAYSRKSLDRPLTTHCMSVEPERALLGMGCAHSLSFFRDLRTRSLEAGTEHVVGVSIRSIRRGGVNKDGD